MKSVVADNKLIAKNTLILYLRMLLYMVVSLYTSRVVLNILGIQDYGIYNVVGGVVTIFTFLNASMSGATSRFLAYELGVGNKLRLKETFSSSLIIHIGISILIFILAETIGLWFLCNKLVIPESRMIAAHWVYQFSILATMINITQVPYNACIIAHEKMSVYAYVEMLNVVLKLLIVYLLLIGTIDKLVLYAALVLAVSILIAFIYRIYCLCHFEECHFHKAWNKKILKPMLSFSGWDLYGNMCSTLRQQGTTMLMNMFFGVLVNAAASIASTVIGSLSVLSSSVLTAFRPPMVKCYANGNMNDFSLLLSRAILFTSLLISVCTVPIVIEMAFVLKIWLNIVPEYAVNLSQIAIVNSFFLNINMAIMVPIYATGNVKWISLTGGTIYLLNLLLLYILLHLGISPYMTYGVNCGVMFLVLIVNSVILKRQQEEIDVFDLWKKKILPIIFIFILVFIGGSLISVQLPEGWLRMVGVFTMTGSTSLLFYWFLLFSSSERKSVIAFIKSKI